MLADCVELPTNIPTPTDTCGARHIKLVELNTVIDKADLIVAKALISAEPISVSPLLSGVSLNDASDIAKLPSIYFNLELLSM